MPRISIVIATYNRGARLLHTLESLAAQTLPPAEWEAVVVDNNCTDDTRALFSGFAAAHPGLGLSMVAEPLQGLSHARNRGIVSSRAPIIAIIDDDEEVEREFAAAYVDFFDRHPSALMAGGGVVPLYETGRPRWMSRFTERPIAGTLDLGGRERPFAGQSGDYRGVKGYPAGGNMALRREAFARFGMFDPSLGRGSSTLSGGAKPRSAAAYLGGEEKELFHRIIDSAGPSDEPPVWWVPGAVIRHIIPPEKLTLSYLRRLSRGVGASERRRTRAISQGAYVRALALEVLKWGATLGLAAGWTLAAQPSKARYVVIMRAEITRGLLRG